MGCRAKKTGREAIDTLFERGNLTGAAKHRKSICASANECGNFCEHLGKEPGEIPWCGHPDAEPPAGNLYEAYKRRDFQCPDGRF